MCSFLNNNTLNCCTVLAPKKNYERIAMMRIMPIIMPLLISLIAGCNKKEVAIATPIQQTTSPNPETPVITKKPHLNANWYTKDTADLNQEMDEYLELAIKKSYVEADPEAVRALVVPHAGLYYSGFCAATAYQTILSSKNLFGNEIKNTKINHVVILAPDHSGMTFGISLPTCTEYQTPLGNISTNNAAITGLKTLKFATTSDKEHGIEHSIEMQLPWIKKTIRECTITPILVGNIDQYDINQLTQELKKYLSDSTLLIVTSDFTHHGPSYHYQVFDEHIINYIRALDSTIMETILTPNRAAFDEVIERTQATICGQNPLKILLSLLGEKQLGNNVEGRLCSYYTSSHLKHARTGSASINVPDLVGDLPDSDAKESVSYAGIVFSNQRVADLSRENQLTSFEKRSLLTLARESIENELAGPDRQPPQLLWPISSPGLSGAQGVFVTLYDLNDKLRGCIGRITSLKPLYQTTQDMALAAAFNDNRFPPINIRDLNNTKAGITILTQPERIFALSNIILGKHGIILNKFKNDGTLLTSAVFLPQVPLSMKWDLNTTLIELSRKAGLPDNGWQDNCEIQIFEGYEIKEEG